MILLFSTSIIVVHFEAELLWRNKYSPFSMEGKNYVHLQIESHIIAISKVHFTLIPWSPILGDE